MTGAPARVVLATRNAGKVGELRALFGAAGISVDDLAAVGLPLEEPAEDTLELHDGFESNARAKARWFAARLPGHVVLADDSGLMVDALDGAPGVRSKRWTGSTASGSQLHAENNAALLRALGGAPSRSARFVSVVVCVDGEREWVARGECEGTILFAPSGDGGFGYDPLFSSDELGVSFGVASREAKSSVSHRGRSFRGLLEQWRAARDASNDAVDQRRSSD